MENTSQFMRLTESEMLNLWKTVMHLQPVHSGLSVERSDGVDLDAILLTRIRQWYAQLLQSAPENVVPVADVKDALSVSVADNGVVTAVVPPQCVRPVEWKLKGWKKSVTLFLEPGAPEVAYMYNDWTSPGIFDPAAIDFGDRLLLFSLPAGELPEVEVARCVVRPADGTFAFHASALSTIPVWKFGF